MGKTVKDTPVSAEAATLLESCHVKENQNGTGQQPISPVFRGGSFWGLIGSNSPRQISWLAGDEPLPTALMLPNQSLIEDNFSLTLEAVLPFFFQCTHSFRITVWNPGENSGKILINTQETWLVKRFTFVSEKKQLTRCQRRRFGLRSLKMSVGFSLNLLLECFRPDDLCPFWDNKIK